MDKKLRTPLVPNVSKANMESISTSDLSVKTVGQAPPPEKVSVEKQYLQYRLDELVKANLSVFNEYNYLLSVLHPPEVKEL